MRQRSHAKTPPFDGVVTMAKCKDQKVTSAEVTYQALDIEVGAGVWDRVGLGVRLIKFRSQHL